jgi:hypothetical protein
MKYETIVIREDRESVANVTANVINESLLDNSKFLEALIRAITNWMKCTDKGKKAFEYSSEDFNIGDLSSYLEDANLKGLLYEQGISDLTVSIYTCAESNPNWVYDTHLFDANELVEESDQ